ECLHAKKERGGPGLKQQCVFPSALRSSAQEPSRDTHTKQSAERARAGGIHHLSHSLTHTRAQTHTHTHTHTTPTYALSIVHFFFSCSIFSLSLTHTHLNYTYTLTPSFSYTHT